MNGASMAAQTRSATTVADVLVPLHEQWLATVHRAIGPALLGTSTVWDRWTAVRYLRDEFAARFENERSLVRRIPRLDREAFQRIEAGSDTLERLRVQVGLAGRHRHTGGLVMLLLQNLLELLVDWCKAVERAVACVPLASLPIEAVQVLTDLEAQGPRAER
jgi:hypothetical protein